MKKPNPPKRRVTWGFNPASRIVPSKKGAYRRSLEKRQARKEMRDA